MQTAHSCKSMMWPSSRQNSKATRINSDDRSEGYRNAYLVSWCLKAFLNETAKLFLRNQHLHTTRGLISAITRLVSWINAQRLQSSSTRWGIRYHLFHRSTMSPKKDQLGNHWRSDFPNESLHSTIRTHLRTLHSWRKHITHLWSRRQSTWWRFLQS